ncbi:hypothetical protein L2V44_14285 [Staphylococcus aureus]|nr:hypothetical protein [Staphylococcus aureus]
MYRRLEDGWITPAFIDGVEQFVEFAKSHPEWMDGDKIRCPCNRRKCQNKIFLDEQTVLVHLGKHRFVPGYYNWHHHGEPYVSSSIKDNISKPQLFVQTEAGPSYNVM